MSQGSVKKREAYLCNNVLQITLFQTRRNKVNINISYNKPNAVVLTPLAPQKENGNSFIDRVSWYIEISIST